MTVLASGAGAGAPAALRDVSAVGCGFITASQLQLGRQVSLTFMTEGRLCGATGTIIRAGRAGSFGVEFAVRNDAYQAFVGALDTAPDDERGRLLRGVRDPQLHVM